MADDTRWIYPPDGKQPAFYQNGKYIYEPRGKCIYWQDGKWWFEMDGGKSAYYVGDDNEWIFDPTGKPSFYYAR